MVDASVFSLAGRRILVTGAAGHIGKNICDYLLQDGATVIAIDNDEVGLKQMESESGEESLFTFVCDLSEETDRELLVGKVSSLTSTLDGVVFAAAFVGTTVLEGWSVDFTEQSLSTWRDALELNLTAPFHIAQLLTPFLMNSQFASIVNIGSIYGSVAPDWSLYEGLAMSNPAAYAASKGGLSQLTRWLAATLAPEIRVNMVSPGGVERNQEALFVSRYQRRTPLGRLASEADVTRAIVFLLSDSSSYVTGQNLFVDGGFAI